MKISKKKILLATGIAAIVIAATVTAFLLLRPTESNDSDYYINGVVEVTFKPEYRDDKNAMEQVARSAGGTLKYYEVLKQYGTHEVIVKPGNEKSAAAYLTSRAEVESAYRSIRGTFN